MLWDLLVFPRQPSPEWWLDRFVAVARDLELPDNIYEARGGAFKGARGRFSNLVESRVHYAWDRKRSTLEACDEWYSGAYLLETVPSALYILMHYAGDPEEAIVRAVNDTKDNDTVAAIVGAAVGALHGPTGFPHRWRANLLGRTAASDDGQVFELLARARELFAMETAPETEEHNK